MKTTVELPDSLLSGAKRYAEAHGVTLKEVIEAGLRSVLAADRSRRRPFRLKRCPFKGKGMAQGLDWTQVRDAVYQGRGA
jgi:hypothetical protein